MPFPQPKKLSETKAKPVEFYLESFLPLPKGKVTLLSARGGTGKTFLLMQAAIKFIQEKKDRKVLLWLSEDESGESRERAENIVTRILGLEQSDTSTVTQNIDIIGSEEITEYINDHSAKEALDFFTPYDLIVLDPLIAFYDGEENSNSEARRFMQHLTRIANVNKQSIVLIHHHGKANDEGKSSTRGASAFIDAARLLYELHYDSENDKHTISIEKENVPASKFHGKSFNRKVLPYSVIVESTATTEPVEDKVLKNGKKSSLWDKI
jgi:replicative DNA helicase